MKHIISFIGILALSILFPLAAYAGPVGKFTNIEGRVDITSPGQAARPAHLGDKVYQGDIIRAKSRSKAEITFVDGNTLRLAQRTRVKITEYITGKERTSGVIKLYRGKIQNKVRKIFGRLFGRSKRNRYEVHTPTSVCGVRGTNFFTYHQKGISGFIFKEGSGYGYSMNRPDAIREISTGQAMVVTSPDQPPMIRSATDMEMQQHEGDTTPSEEPEEEGEEEKVEETDEAVEKEGDEGSPEEGEGDEGDTVEGDEEGTDEGAIDDAAEGDEGDEGSLDEGDAGVEESLEGDVEDAGEGDQGSAVEGDMGDTEEGQMASAGEGDEGGAVEGDIGAAGEGDTGDMQGGDMAGGDISGGYMAEGDMSGGYIAGDDMLGDDMLGDDMLGDDMFGDDMLGDDMFGDDMFGDDMFGDDMFGDDMFGDDMFSDDISAEFLLGDDVYIPPDVTAIPTSTTWAFNGGTFRLVSGTYYEAKYHTPREYPLWPYDNGQTPDRFPYDGSHYEYGYLVNNESGLRIYGFKEIWDPVTGYWTRYEYLPDKTKVTAEGIEYEIFPDSLQILTWDTFPSDLSQPPPSDTNYELLYSESLSSNALVLNGWFRGEIGEMTNPWASTSATPAQISLYGEYSISNSPSLFLTVINDTTPDGGAYVGPIGGYINNVTGRIYAIYMNPGGNEAGVLRGAFSGPVYPGSQEWEATGTLYRHLSNSYSGSVTAATLLNSLEYGGIHIDKTHGTFSGTGSIGPRGEGWGVTTSIQGEDWGVFGLLHASENFYANPSGYNYWSAKFSGWGDFGSYQDNSGVWKNDYGIWVGWGSGNTWDSNRLSGDLTGQFLTLTGKGTILGETLGTYTGTSSGTYQAVSMGSWNKYQDLTFSSRIEGGLYRLNPEVSGYYKYANGSRYDYHYATDNTRGSSSYYNASSNTDTFRRLYKRGPSSVLYQDTWVYDHSTQELQSFSVSTPGTFPTLSSPPDNIYTASYSWNDYDIWPSGDFEGIMGGLNNLWTADVYTPANITFLGRYGVIHPDNFLNKPHIFADLFTSYNPYNDTLTTPDGGAYVGLIGGIFDDVGATGKIRALYIDPYNYAGILKGSFSGSTYPNVGVWLSDGNIYPIEMDTGVVVTPQNLAQNITNDRFLFGGYYNEGLSTYKYPGRGDFYNSGGTDVGDITVGGGGHIFSSITGQDWGVWRAVLSGTYSGTTSGHWTFDFDDKLFDWNNNSETVNLLVRSDFGVDEWGTITGIWSGEQIEGEGLGCWANLEEATPKTGISAGEIVGTFDPATYTWQGTVVGSWIETSKFLEMAGKIGSNPNLAALQALNIPCVEIGNATLSIISDTYFSDLSLNDVTFFRYSTGTEPRIWATNNVSGTYTSTPPVGHTATLESSPSGLNATFKVKRWDNNKWGAHVDGNGTLTTTNPIGSTSIEFQGVAAGAYTGSTSGSLTGKGAGVARSQ